MKHLAHYCNLATKVTYLNVFFGDGSPTLFEAVEVIDEDF